MNAPPAPWTDSGAKASVQMDSDNHLARVALTIPAGLVAALPKQPSEAVFPLEGAGLVQSANLQWHPLGHPPAHVYDVPHFDLHFYTISEAVRSKIVPGSPLGKVMPSKAILPPKTMLAPGFVPGMGMHDIPLEQPEFHGGAFGITPIVGYWNGEIDFFEVMFTRAWLLQKHDVVAAFPQPASVNKHGAYPTKYRVTYDKDADTYEVALTDFRER